MDDEKDFDTPEGVYASSDTPSLVKIQRVCGDCSVETLVIARSEAKSLIGQLQKLVGEA